MEFVKKYHSAILCSIPIISLLLHLHVFTQDLTGIHVWRQTETQTVINNFYRGDFNILNPHINAPADTNLLHRMEFPLMQWIIALLYKIFGAHIAVTRGTIFIIGLFSVYGMYRLSYNMSGNKTIATIAAWCFNFSPVFYYYTINPIPDNLALCCGTWCLTFFYSYINTRSIKYVFLSACFLCIATLAKLPFIIYGTFIATFVLLTIIKKDYKQLLPTTLIFSLLILPAAAWYIWVMPHWEIGAVRGITDTTWNHPDYYHVISFTLISILPELIINYASVLLFLAGFYFFIKRKKYNQFTAIPFMALGLVVIFYFLFEMNIIDVVHDYYLFPFLPLIFLLVPYGAFWLLQTNKQLKYLTLTCLLILPLTAYLRINSRWDLSDPGFNHVYYDSKKELRSLTPTNALCVVGNDVSRYILLYYIDRKGWTFDQDWMDDKLLGSYIEKGAEYLFIDSRIDTTAGIKKHLGEKIFDKETLRVYKLIK